MKLWWRHEWMYSSGLARLCITYKYQISVTWKTKMFFFFMLCTHHGTLGEEDSFTLAAQEPRQTSSWTLAVVLERRESLIGSGISGKMLINVHSSELVTELEPHPTPGEGQEIQSYYTSRLWRAGTNVRNDHHSGETGVQVSRKQNSWWLFHNICLW